MKAKIFIYGICIFGVALVQSTLLDFIRVYGVKPNLLLVFIICVALLRGNVEGAVIGFISGLVQDALTGTVLGFYALLGLYLGLIIGSVNKRLYRDNFLVVVFFVFLSSVVYEVIVYAPSLISYGKSDFTYLLKGIILPEAIYNIAALLLMYVPVIWINDRLEGVEKVARKY